MFLKAIYEELFPINAKTNVLAVAPTAQQETTIREISLAPSLEPELSEISQAQARHAKAIEDVQGRIKEIQDLLVNLLFVNPNEVDHLEKGYPMLTWLREELAILKSISAGNQLRDQNYARFANKVMAIQSAVLANVETSKALLEGTSDRGSNELDFQLADLRDDITTQIRKNRASNNFVFTLLFLLVLSDIGLFLWTKFPTAIVNLLHW